MDPTTPFAPETSVVKERRLVKESLVKRCAEVQGQIVHSKELTKSVRNRITLHAYRVSFTRSLPPSSFFRDFH